MVLSDTRPLAGHALPTYIRNSLESDYYGMKDAVADVGRALTTTGIIYGIPSVFAQAITDSSNSIMPEIFLIPAATNMISGLYEIGIYVTRKMKGEKGIEKHKDKIKTPSYELPPYGLE